jgi:Spy/CpxP family protein refolding chaperone
MKKIGLILPLALFVWNLHAQVSSDSSHIRRNFYERGYRLTDDSLHRRNMRGFAGEGGPSMNRLQNPYGNRRFHSYRRSSPNHNHRIHFSPDQRKQLADIRETYRKKSMDLYKNDKMTIGEYKSQLLALEKEKKSRMLAILTPEQKQEQVKWKKQARENRQVRDAALLERMRIQLQLNDDQTASIRSQRAGLRGQMQSIRENEDLLPYQKMEQIRALASKQKELLKSILTLQQYSEFENMHRQRLGEK